MPASLEFLGRHGPPLGAAAEWLADRHGGDMGELVVALPGARAARSLLARLARRLGPAWSPPRVTTIGRAVDELLVIEGHRAGRAVRTLAWEQALRALPPATLVRLIARRPDDDDASSWARLAEEVRGLFGELAAEGLDFRRVLEGDGVPAHLSVERGRWEVLVAAQEGMVAALEAAGLVDTHLARLEALEAGRIEDRKRVVLVGVAETNELQGRVLTRLDGRVTALVLAPPGEAAGFDSLGRLVVERWAERDVPLSLDRWRVAVGPEDQAREALDAIASWEGTYPAEEISLGVCDPEVTPYLTRRLEDLGVTARDAAGTPVARTAPAVLLSAVAAYLSSRSFAAFAALARHPDLERVLRDRPGLGEIDAPSLLDAHLERHLPQRADGSWPRATRDSAALDALRDGILGILGELTDDGARVPGAWVAQVRSLLVCVFGGQDLDEDDPCERQVIGGLRAIGATLAEFEELPPSLAPTVTAQEALRRLLRVLHSEPLPAPAPRPGEPTVDLLGWLELPLDDAPALVVTGFQDAQVHGTAGGDAWLPNSLRRQLGLVDDRRRLARDAYSATLLLESRAQVVFVSGRRSREGDPLLPSRLAFHAPEVEIPARMASALAPRAAPRLESDLAEPEGRPLPTRGTFEPPAKVSVTAFKTLLQSPYLFYLSHVLGLDSFGCEGRELDPASFGSLAHRALEVLRSDELCACTDPAKLGDALEEELRRLARARFGQGPLPAVSLQLDQMLWRLRILAQRQAARAAEGWRIAHVEWKPSGPVPLSFDDHEVELRGKVDRIDVHADGRWALLDYKTSETRVDPAKAHRNEKTGKWKDLQLPLYAFLAGELGFEGAPELGYASLGRTDGDIGFETFCWNGEELSEAVECARELLRLVWAGPPFELERAHPFAPVVQAICGQGLLVGATPETHGEEAET